MHANQLSVGAAGSQLSELERARRLEKLHRLAFLQEALAEIRYTQRSSWDSRLKALAEKFRAP